MSAPVEVTLSADEVAALRLAARRVADAQREAELAASRARVKVGEAIEDQIQCLRAIAVRHNFDQDAIVRLLPTGVLLVGVES